MIVLRKVSESHKLIQTLNIDGASYTYLAPLDFVALIATLSNLHNHSTLEDVKRFTSSLYRARCIVCCDDYALIKTNRSIFCEQCKSYEPVRAYKIFPRWRWNG